MLAFLLEEEKTVELSRRLTIETMIMPPILDHVALFCKTVFCRFHSFDSPSTLVCKNGRFIYLFHMRVSCRPPEKHLLCTVLCALAQFLKVIREQIPLKVLVHVIWDPNTRDSSCMPHNRIDLFTTKASMLAYLMYHFGCQNGHE